MQPMRLRRRNRLGHSGRRKRRRVFQALTRHIANPNERPGIAGHLHAADIGAPHIGERDPFGALPVTFAKTKPFSGLWG